MKPRLENFIERSDIVLERIEFKNFRCFQNSKLSIRDLTIIVGKNNSGKSTIIEALRIITLATKKYNRTIYIQPPASLGLPIATKGFKLPVERIKIDLRGVVYYYDDGNAKITATFSDKVKIVVHLNKEVAFATIYDKDKNIVTTKAKANLLNISSIGILPQIGLMKEKEKLLSQETVEEDIDTYLSSRHFRNEMLLYQKDKFNDFKKLAEETWQGLRIRELIFNKFESENISLIIEDARFPAEIGVMGSGIQMWLQIIWFICRSKGSDTIILDEPDVYMHPDMQLKILKLVKSLYQQVIIATHSVEIITNVSPQNIVTIDKNNRQMFYANHLTAVQNIVDDIGSVHNLSLVKLGSAKKCVFVEGKDMKILQQFYNALYPNDMFSLETLPTLPLGGFTRINEAFGASKLFNENTKNQFKCYAILDRDYYLESQINELYAKANENHLLLHVWNRKELENYILIPSVIYKITQKPLDEYSNFISEYEKLVDKFKDATIDAYTTKIYEVGNGRIAPGTAAKQARDYVNSKWTNLDEKLKLVCGKDLLKSINGWLKDTYGKSCSMNKIFRVMEASDINAEIIEVINNLKSN